MSITVPRPTRIVDTRTRSYRRPRVAIAHDYLTQLGGAERVALAMTRAFPEAPLYTTLYEPDHTFPEFRDCDIRVTPINRMRYLRQQHRYALPLLPFASSRHFIDADVVIASSSGWAHGFPTSGKRIVYCHTPARWTYLPDDYFGERQGMTRTMMQVASPALRRWDRRAAMGATTYLCNSSIVRDRVQRIYGIDSQVLNAPHSMIVDGDQVAVGELLPWHEAYIRPYVMVSRLMPYKNVRQAIEAFRMMPDEHLVVVGRGPLEPELRMGLPANVRIVGGLSDAQLRWVYSHGAGIVAPCHEDYGLTPLEGGAFGLPVLALRAGGYLDTVIEGVSGLFFDSPTPEAIVMTVRDNSHRVWDHAAIMRHADRFSEGEFARALHASVDEVFNRSV